MDNKHIPQGVAVVTGAAGGIGAATASALCDAKYPTLLLCDLHAEQLEAAAGPLRATGAEVLVLEGDIAAPDFSEKLIARLGSRPIAALVHTAGLSPRMAEPERILEVNFAATERLVDAIRDHMAAGAAAVLIASNSAYFPMPPKAAAAFSKPLPSGGVAALAHLAPTKELAYPLSKLGVMALAKRQAKAFGERGARLVSISPGGTDTVMMQLEADNALLNGLIARQAIPRIARTEEIAAVALFLCSPAASYLTGTDVLVDGGLLAAADL